MSEPYNPIMRTFCRFRAGVLSCIDVDRHEIRPATPLDALLPEPSRRAVWDRLRRQGMRPPSLEFSERDKRRMAWAVLRGTISAAISLRSLAALLVAFPMALAVYQANRRRAVILPLGMKTVGEAHHLHDPVLRAQRQQLSMDPQRDRAESPLDHRGDPRA